ncbi:uncharacterized protein L201_002993 [Kwoniella dendrophila CBS 6074]|uniref:Conserved oligomeric Golgi complex subunit 1 n=1 Tax=Kwoniella dendrophila CBS 6074 TaxID=1295534 RepID=A0AAX4JTF7_9TREE
MSVRSTPGPTSYPSLPTFQTPEASSSKRSIRAPSYVSRPSVADPNYSHRQQSINGYSQRQQSITYAGNANAPSVITGTSTPTILGIGSNSNRRKRIGTKNEDGTITPLSKDDWANMEPDEVFKKLPVNEVRKVENKMRNDALNKQSELRSMVGTRYRDLLTSATQIQSLHSSSLRLSDSLREIARSCNNPDININIDGEGSENGNENEDDDLLNMLPTAAHMKLLLDAPEALYSYLAHHQYLNAAFLWLITRVVKESLSAMPEEQNGSYIPLLQKQWETLTPFRAQIVQRATASLRTKDKFDSKSLSETILSIILLDNLPISESLDLLLSQRTKALKDTLQHVESTSSKNSLSPEKDKSQSRKRSNSRIQNAANIRSTIQERSSISNIITDSINLMLETVSSAKTVFDKSHTHTQSQTQLGPIDRGLKQEESLIEEMMRLIQKGETTLPSTTTNQSNLPPNSRKNSHQRRASRLASISIPRKLSTQNINGTNLSSINDKPPITSSEIIQNLPSSQILLRYLPNNVIGFTPFILTSISSSSSSSSVSGDSNLIDKLDSWQKQSINLLEESLPNWLKDLKNVKDIWIIRNSINELLSKSKEDEFENSIKFALEDQWSIRVKQVWIEKLENLLQVTEKDIRDAGEKIRNGLEKSDILPESNLFSDLSFPTGPTTTSFSSISHTTALTSFRSTLKKRSSLRTPLLDDVLNTFEELAKSIKDDMSDLPGSLYDEYSIQINNTLNKLVQSLDNVLDSMGPSRGDGKIGIEAELFIGRISLYLSKESDFLRNIAGYGKLDQDSIEAFLIDVHARSAIRWRDRAIQEALVLLAPLFDPYRGSQEIKSSWQGETPSSPSHPIMISLQSLVKSTKLLGIPPSLNGQLTVTEGLVKGFVKNAKSLEGWKSQEEFPENCLQSAVDIGFLVHLSGDKVDSDTLVKHYLEKANSSYPSFTSTTIQGIIDQSIKKSQLLIYSLLSHLTPSSATIDTPKISYSYGLDNRNAALLRFGTPQSGNKSGISTSTEFKSPVVAAKPGKRMGLLSIAA